jgi:acyl-CoA reductase-like NAD-dependent aldehyde dehydrogenase
VKGYVDLGVQEGAALVVDGRDHVVVGAESGYFLGGCLFDRVTASMRIYQEEIFGPVLCVVRVADYEQALQLVNAHEFGNGTAIFTRDGDAADFVARPVGMVGVVCRSGAGCLPFLRWLALSAAAGRKACVSTPSSRPSRRAGPPASAVVRSS